MAYTYFTASPHFTHTHTLSLFLTHTHTHHTHPPSHLPHPHPTPTLSSLSHFSTSCFLPWASTGLHSSSASYLFNWLLSSRMPKYCSSGEVCPGCVGTCWNRWIVSGVRRIPCTGGRVAQSTITSGLMTSVHP